MIIVLFRISLLILNLTFGDMGEMQCILLALKFGFTIFIALFLSFCQAKFPITAYPVPFAWNMFLL